MKKVGGIAAAVLSAAFLVATPAEATEPQDVLIEIQTTGSGDGPFTATGPVCASGTTSTPLRLTAGFQSGSGGNILVAKEFTCDDGSGSFVLLLRVKIAFDPFSDSFTWSVLGGTGAYAGLHGSGTGFGTPQPEFLLDTLTGGMHID
jgi:hypothetical protein